MAFPPEVRRQIVQYQSAVRQLRSRVGTFAGRAWSGLGSYRDADIDRLVRALTPIVLGGQLRIAAMTDAYLAAVATASGVRQRPLGIPAREVSGARTRGVDPAEVYRRPGVTVWTALAAGEPLHRAVDMGRSRLVGLVTTDLQLAKTHAVQWRQQRDDTVVGYRRVLGGGDSCALCTLASTQRYTTGDLMPIHPGCGCDVAEIRGSVDPGQVIDPDLLDDLRQRAGDGQAMTVRDHGEYGPTLTWSDQEFTGPTDI